ncbi:hypothetical protein, partial [Bacillus altitudinis]|uniref:hypothetical protein n=1 Tax=Bacillus altitudinis TaxID=293387 RepID=UPI001643CAD8
KIKAIGLGGFCFSRRVAGMVEGIEINRGCDRGEMSGGIKSREKVGGMVGSVFGMKKRRIMRRRNVFFLIVEVSEVRIGGGKVRRRGYKERVEGG